MGGGQSSGISVSFGKCRMIVRMAGDGGARLRARGRDQRRHARAHEGARRPAADDRARPRARAGDDRDRVGRTPEAAAWHRRLPRRHPASPPGSSRSCGPAASGLSTSATTGARRGPSRSTSTRPASWRSSTTCSPRSTSSGSRRSNRVRTRRCAAPASRPSRAEEFAARLDALSHEFIALPRNGDLEFGLLITLYPTTRLNGAMTAAVDTPREPRLDGRYYKLFSASVVSNLGDGVGIIAYPWLASAVTRDPLLVALVMVAQRLPWLVFTLPAGVITDRVDRRKAMVAMDMCRFVLTLAVAFAVLGRQGDAARPGRPRRGHRHADRPLPDRAAGDGAARHGGGAARQLGADDPAGHRRQEPAREGQRPDVERRRASPTSSSGRRSDRSCSRSPSRCRSSSTRRRSSWPPRSCS